MSSSDLTSAAMGGCAFPGDIILEILLRLPAKSLLRFRCVCKSWFSLITNSSFITRHLTQNTNENLIIRCGGHINSEAVISMLIYGKKTLDRSINIELPFPGSIVKIVGSCNGLICCITQWRLGWKISLWNPSTREYRNLPKPGITAVELLLRCCSICLGFGFDAKANDYKLVRLLCCMDPRLQPIYKAEVYSKNTDSWKEINAVLQCCVSDSLPSVFFGGGVHWIASGSGRSELIAYFDLDGEGFGEIQLPDSFGFGITIVKELAVFKDFLAVVSTSGRDLNRCIDVWVMKEYGVKESWTQQLSIVPFSGVVRQIACFRNGNFVLQNYQDRLFLYNSNTQELDKLPVCSAGYIHDIHTCMESLVSIREGN